MNFSATKTLGFVPVDSGTLCIVDPCYLVPGEGHHPMTHEMRMEDGPVLLAHQAGTGLIFGGFGGDGTFRVRGTYSKTGLLMKVIIDLGQ